MNIKISERYKAMQTVIFCMMFPVIGMLIWNRCQNNKPVTRRELLIRYVVYTLTANLITSLIMMFLCDEGTSFQVKMDTSPIFVLKFAILELISVLIVVGVEWAYVSRRLKVTVNWQEYRETWLGKIVEKVLLPYGIYFVAAAVVLLNVGLMFDNVLWGDECFSANTAQRSAGDILQILYYWDNHPPLHYYWLKMFGDIFGHVGPVYHLASLVPFIIAILFALLFFRRHFGNIPTAFFVIITGLSSNCLQYNLEIRMYSLAFLGVTGCCYCAYRVLSGGRLAWFGMVFWALVGAYSHYYAMMTVGILIFITGVASAVRYRGKTWVKGLLSLLAYIIGYAPWLSYLFHGTASVSNSWWITDILSLRDSLQMVLCGISFQKIILGLLLIFLGVLLLSESSFFQINRCEGVTEISVHRPRLKNWSNESYGTAVGALTIAGTLVAAYALCLIIAPVLAQRYLYPISAITVFLLMTGAQGCLKLAKTWGEKLQKRWIEHLAKIFLVFSLVALSVIGLNNYKAYRTQVNAEKAATEQVLNLIGEVPKDTALISNNVKHLAWTVLYYYYPERDILAADCANEEINYDKFWYFNTRMFDVQELEAIQNNGYIIVGYYGPQQISIYPFHLYYIEKIE